MKILAFTIACLITLITTPISGQIDITQDRITNLTTGGSVLLPTFGSINHNSFSHNFLHNGTRILSIGEFGMDLEPNERITRQQPGGFKVDLLPFAMGTINRVTGSGTLTNDTGNFTINAQTGGAISVTFDDSSVVTDDLVVHVTP